MLPSGAKHRTRRRRWGWVAGALLVGLATPAAAQSKLPEAVRSIVDAADRVEVFAISAGSGREVDPQKLFRGWAILGRTTLAGDDRRAALDAIVQGVERHSSSRPFVRCFAPQHGVRIGAGPRSLDLVISYRDQSILTYFGETRGEDLETEVTAHGVLNHLLAAARVPVSNRWPGC